MDRTAPTNTCGTSSRSGVLWCRRFRGREDLRFSAPSYINPSPLRGPLMKVQVAMSVVWCAGSSEPANLSPLRPHPEEPERSEGVSKDGHEPEPAAMVRDGALRAPPHHEAERIELVPSQDRKVHSLSG